METFSKTSPAITSVKTERVKTNSALAELLNNLEINRLAIIPILLVCMACLGGIAAAFAVQESEIKLMAVAVSTTFVEILIIAVAPVRMIVATSIIAFVIDLLVFIF